MLCKCSSSRKSFLYLRPKPASGGPLQLEESRRSAGIGIRRWKTMASDELVWAGPFLFGVTKGRNRPQWPNSPTLLMSSRNRTNWSIRSPRPMPPPPLPTTVRRSLFLSARRRAALALRAGAGTRGPWEMHIGIAALWALILPLPDAAWAFRVARRSTAVARRRSIRPVGGGRRYATSCPRARGRTRAGRQVRVRGGARGVLPRPQRSPLAGGCPPRPTAASRVPPRGGRGAEGTARTYALTAAPMICAAGRPELAG